MAKSYISPPGLFDQNPGTEQPCQAVSAAGECRLLRCAKRTRGHHLLKDRPQTSVAFGGKHLNAALPVQIEKLGLRAQCAEPRGSYPIGDQVSQQLCVKRNQGQIAEPFSSCIDSFRECWRLRQQAVHSSLVQGET